MGARGRQSKDDKTVLAPVESIPRARPPDTLTDPQKDVWCRVVNSMPADWFYKATHDLLMDYCRTAVTLRKLGIMLEKFESQESGFDLVEYDRVQKMYDRASSGLKRLATSLRISPQTTYDKSKKKGRNNSALWEHEG